MAMVQPAHDPRDEQDQRDELYEAYLRVPPHQHAEIVHGTLYVMSRPAPKHANAASVLGAELGAPFQRGRGGPGGWWILFEPELHFGEDVLVPDIAGWRRERMPGMPDEAYFTLAPDWVCEVLSPHNERHDRLRKMPVYARGDVRHAWLVDPLDRTVEVLRLEAGKWTSVTTYRKDQIIKAEPFEAVEIDLLPVWGESRG
jgi:Uma2 family endonuclease